MNQSDHFALTSLISKAWSLDIFLLLVHLLGSKMVHEFVNLKNLSLSEKVYFVYWVRWAGARKEIQEKGSEFWTSAYFCETNIPMHLNMEQQQQSWH